MPSGRKTQDRTVPETPDYSRALIRLDHHGAEDDEVDRYVQLRKERQSILRRPIDPPLLRVALRESVLRCPVGGAAVMAGQLRQLAEASELPNVAGAIYLDKPHEVERYDRAFGGIWEAALPAG